MNFSGVSNRTIVGKLFRLPLALIPSKTALPILQGKLKGKKWIVGSSNHGCWLGSYEYAKRCAFERAVREGAVVFDIGAHAGFYTLLASVLVGAQGRVFAFEPAPRNLCYLKEHLRINGIKNVSVIEGAVSDCDTVAQFDEGPNHSMGHLAPGGRLAVRTASLDEMMKRGELLPPDYMKIDVEGAEANVLLGAKSVLTAHRPTIFLATHGKELHSTCCELLRSLGYSVEPISGPALGQTDEVLAYAKHRTSGGIATC